MSKWPQYPTFARGHEALAHLNPENAAGAAAAPSPDAAMCWGAAMRFSTLRYRFAPERHLKKGSCGKTRCHVVLGLLPSGRIRARFQRLVRSFGLRPAARMKPELALRCAKESLESPQDFTSVFS